MNVWLITIGEPVPYLDDFSDRLHRTGYLANLLQRNGDSVTWWTSTFNHFNKIHHVEHDTIKVVNSLYKIILIKGCGYKKHISYQRFRDHKIISDRFKILCRNEKKPDVILAALPTLELCEQAIGYGKQNNIPTIIDLRDMWPDIFVDAMPRLIRPISKIIFYNFFKQSKWICKNATAIIGITDLFVDWGLKRGNRNKTQYDRTFPLGYDLTDIPEHKMRDAATFWEELGIRKEQNILNVCFIGTMGRQLDLETIIKAFNELKKRNASAKLILCGNGDMLDYYKKLSLNNENIIFSGWIDNAKIRELLKRVHLGFDPLPNRYDFLSTINNKAYEYISTGVPIIASPQKGVLFELIQNENIGMSYETGNAESLVNILLELNNQKDRIKPMSINAKKLYNGKFKSEVIYMDMINYLKKVKSI